MKQLYLNNRRVVLSDDTYFPFTQKVSDIEDVSIIGLIATKSVKIPICPANDEIFGFIADITRVAIGSDDNKIGVSFNQIKKCEYILYNNSEIISTGVIRIANITDADYEIELYDSLIDKIETLRGDESTGEGFLSELDIILSDDSTFSMECKAFDIKDTLNNDSSEVKPCFDIKEFDSSGKDARVTYVPTSGSSYQSTVELASDLTPISFRALKGYELDYAIPVSTVIRSVNNTYDILSYDSGLNTLFDSLHFKLGSPKAIPSRTTYSITGASLATYTGYVNTITPTSDSSIDLKIGTTWKLQENGKYKVKFPITITMIPTISTDYISSFNGVDFYPLTPDGTKIGEVYLNTYIASYDGIFPNFTNIPQNIKIDLYKEENTVISYDIDERVTQIVISHTVEMVFDYYPAIWFFTNENKLRVDFGYFLQNTYFFFTDVYNEGTSTMDRYNYYHSIDTTIGTISVEYESTDFRTGDILNGQTLFPKISIHEFIINLAKLFNLDLSIVAGKIHIKQKVYASSPEIPIIDTITAMEVPTFNFSKLILTSDINDSDAYKSYEKLTKKKFGQQIINTGYNIKRNTKTINFSVATSGLLIDYNAYGYGEFAGYRNAGYSRNYFGVTSGLEDTLTFGFINKIEQPMCIGNDTPYEAALLAGTGTPTEVKFTMTNTLMKYYQTSGEFEYPTADSAGYTRYVDNFYTLSPYKFNTSGVITDSLDMSKPDYNFAGIFDANYPLDTTIYQKYHKKIIQDIYNVNTHIITVKMFIDGVIDIYKIYNIRNSMYLIYEIPEYDPTIPNLYEIKLIRVNSISNYQ